MRLLAASHRVPPPQDGDVTRVEGVQRFLGGGESLQRGAGHHVLQHLGGGGVLHHTNGLALQ